MIDRIPCQPGLIMQIVAPVAHLCPFADEVDEGTVTLGWVTTEQTFELHSLAAWLASFKPIPISHEDLTAALVAQSGSAVTTTWTTAGMSVRCTAGGAHALPGKPDRSSNGGSDA